MLGRDHHVAGSGASGVGQDDPQTSSQPSDYDFYSLLNKGERWVNCLHGQVISKEEIGGHGRGEKKAVCSPAP